jgi:hypothetical protein
VTTSLYQNAAPVTASKVVSSHPTPLHGILLNSVAATATIQLFDDITTTSPQNPITGVITPGAIVVPTFVPIDVETSKGLVIMIAVAAANVTPIGRFSA